MTQAHTFAALYALASGCMASANPNVEEQHRLAGVHAAKLAELPRDHYLREQEETALLIAVAMHETDVRADLSTAEHLLCAAIIAARAAGEELPLPALNPDGPYRPELAEAFREGARQLGGEWFTVPPAAEVWEGEGGAIVHCRVFVSDSERPLMEGEEGEPTVYPDVFKATRSALPPGVEAGDNWHPAIAALGRYVAEAPDNDPGEGTWHDQESAAACGARQESYSWAKVVRPALAAIGFPVPAGKPTCSGCGVYTEEEEHEHDCTAPRWTVTLSAAGVQVTAANESQATRYAEGDLNDSSLGPWNVTAEVEPASVEDDPDSEAVFWEVELQDSEKGRGERLWTFTGTASLTIIAADASAALAEALELQRCELVASGAENDALAGEG